MFTNIKFNLNRGNTKAKVFEKGEKRKRFEIEEDEKLKQLVSEYGTTSWECISKKMNGRSPRKCRERWVNYLSEIKPISVKDSDCKSESKKSNYSSKRPDEFEKIIADILMDFNRDPIIE